MTHSYDGVVRKLKTHSVEVKQSHRDNFVHRGADYLQFVCTADEETLTMFKMCYPYQLQAFFPAAQPADRQSMSIDETEVGQADPTGGGSKAVNGVSIDVDVERKTRETLMFDADQLHGLLCAVFGWAKGKDLELHSNGQLANQFITERMERLDG